MGLRRQHILLWTLVCSVLVGCPDRTVQPPSVAGPQSDAAPILETVTPDTTPGQDGSSPDVPPEADYESCLDNSDCDSGYCVLTQEGSVCTEPCVSDCPKGFQCKLIVTGSADPTLICLPAHLTLCFPCNVDQDCTSIPGALVPYDGIRCLSYGTAGNFCGGVCEKDTDCPDDFSCIKTTDGPTRQCMPDSGQCGCSSLSESMGASTQCYVEGPAGEQCFGTVQCIDGALSECPASPPSPEDCNGLDNDCDGLIDNNLSPPPSDLQGGICLGSKKVCDGSAGWQEPNYQLLSAYEAVELSCDGKDNDCDGEVDIGLSAPAATLQEGVCAGAEQVCLGAAGWSDANYGLLPNYETNETLCDGMDNDCDGQTDEELTVGAPLASNQEGVCKGAFQTCTSAGGWGEPDYNTAVENYEEVETLCDNLDNDCDGETDEGFVEGGSVFFEGADGALLSKGAACGVGNCVGGSVSCGADGLTLVCSSLASATPDTCDGFDNDCNPDTPDGTDDPSLGLACDGEDSDLCKEGTFTCEAGVLTCIDIDDNDPDLCDGQDNDCNPATLDGFGEPNINAPCDGEGDTDLCKEGIVICVNTVLSCNDLNDVDPDFCDGIDNDCNPETPDGADDANVNIDCDGDDSDLCKEGKSTCNNGIISCLDIADDDAEICDGLDNDCNPGTPDGLHDPGLADPCDGSDADLCNEGVKFCVEGALLCNDQNDDNPELCDGEDNDCDPDTPDGADESSLGQACDGSDTDQCPEGQLVCQNAGLICDDLTDNLPDLCDGQDNDCNPNTPDGQDDPSTGSNTCETANGSVIDVPSNGQPVVISGGFNSGSKSDFFTFNFVGSSGVGSSGSNVMDTSIDLNGAGYVMRVLPNCGGGPYNHCNSGGQSTAGQVTAWSIHYEYTPGAGCCENQSSVTQEVTVQVFRSVIGSACDAYTLTAKHSL